MRAVNFRSTISLKRPVISPVTTSPSGVGRRNLPSFTTYSRSRIVEIVGAYVLGRPTPVSSISRISVASVYLAGGWVNFCSCFSSRSVSGSPAFRSGSGGSFSSASSSRLSSYTAV